jgi:hypothetical protein
LDSSVGFYHITDMEENNEQLTSEVVTDLEVANKLIKLYQSSKDRKIDFDLTLKKVRQLLQVKTCYYTGVPFEEDGPLSRSVDRVDSSLGYVDDNVVACTVDINGKKANLTNEEIELLYTKLKQWNKVKTARKS